LATSILFLAVSAQADWLLSEYATPTPDSTLTRSVYGITTTQNLSSSATTSVPGGYVQLDASKIASDGTEGYTAEIGLVHPLTEPGKIHDLTGLQAITFEYQNSTTMTDGLWVTFRSPVYADAYVQAGTVYEYGLVGKAACSAGTTWKSAMLDFTDMGDFALPKWWTPPADFPPPASVLKQVTTIVFSPRTLYTQEGSHKGVACTRCVGPDMKTQSLKIRNVRLVGISAPGSDTVVPPPPTDSVAKPAIPVLVSPSHGSLNALTDEHLVWTKVVDAQSYLVQADTSVAFSDPMQVRVTGDNSWVSFGLEKNRKYVWRVQATNAGGSSEWSPVWTFTTGTLGGGAVSVQKARALRGWRRSGDQLTVVVPGSVQRATMDVRGLDGKLVRTGSAAPRAGEATCDIGNLHGTFLLQVRSGNKPLENGLIVLP